MPAIPVLVAALLGAGPEVFDAPPSTAQSAQGCAPAIACAAILDSTEQVLVAAGSDGRSGDGLLVHPGQMVIKYQLTSALEFDLYSNTLFLPGIGRPPVSAEGVQPGLKVALSPESAWLPSFDASVHLTVPSWNPGQTWDFEAWWYFSKTFSFLRADLNLMFAVADVRGAPALQGLGTLTLTADLGRGVTLFGEAFATWGDRPALPPGAGVFSGLSVAVTDELALDVGAEAALHVDRGIFTVFAGVTWVPQGQLPVAPVAVLGAP
ncbi:MAG: hypothetical protein Q8L48_38285 [Archangium sp.]|nr:hypothetical protein [Archangium sp.]